MIVTQLAVNSEKKHSVRFDAKSENPGVTSLYVTKSHLSRPFPPTIISVILTPEEWEKLRAAADLDGKAGA